MTESANLHYTSTKLVNNEILEQGVHLISLKRNFNFIPGQLIAITLDFTIEPRLYSIASGVNDPLLKILFDVKPEGKLTNIMAKLIPGEELYISNPIGTFTCDNSKAIWIASGTGIAPYASMLYSGLSDKKTLIHGGKSLTSFFFQSDFIKILGEKYIRCCSRHAGTGVYYGRLTSYLKEIPELDPNQMYYLCGNAEMVVEVREILIGHGVPFEKIMAEIYF
jgi:ferredoxin/flavodoxin---NADP+ reductase